MKIRIRAVPMECFRTQGAKRKKRSKKMSGSGLGRTKSACFRTGSALGRLQEIMDEAHGDFFEGRLPEGQERARAMLNMVKLLLDTRRHFGKEYSKLVDDLRIGAGYVLRLPDSATANDALYRLKEVGEIYREIKGIAGRKCDAFA